MKEVPTVIAKMSQKNQIVIPTAARNLLGLSGGDEIVLIPKGKVFVMFKKPKAYKKTLSGFLSNEIGAKLRKEIKRNQSSW